MACLSAAIPPEFADSIYRQVEGLAAMDSRNHTRQVLPFWPTTRRGLNVTILLPFAVPCSTVSRWASIRHHS